VDLVHVGMLGQIGALLRAAVHHREVVLPDGLGERVLQEGT
jgi:hypothetical protein